MSMWRDKVAVITGAGGGIGAALAKHCAAQGMHVIAADIDEPGLAETQKAIAATRFSPDGLRGACPCCRSGGHFIRNWEAYVDDEHSRTGAIPLVETQKGFENIGEICSVAGLEALMVGPFDLSVSMGFHGDWRRKEVANAVEQMVRCGVDAGLNVIMPVFATSLRRQSP